MLNGNNNKKEDIQTANKFKKKYSISFGITEMYPSEGLKLKRLLIPSVGENTEQ